MPLIMKKRLFITILFFLLLSAAPCTQCLELVWSDEFAVNGAPNPQNWGYDLGTGQSGWGDLHLALERSELETAFERF